MSDTRIIDWQSIDHLQLLFGKTLKTVKYSISQEARAAREREGKVFSGTIEDRVYLIAKLPALEKHNGTTVRSHFECALKRQSLRVCIHSGHEAGTNRCRAILPHTGDEGRCHRDDTWLGKAQGAEGR